MNTELANMVEAIAAFGLDGRGFGAGAESRILPIEVDAEQVSGFIAAIEENRILGTAIRALMEEQLVLPEAGASELTTLHDEAMSASMGAECVAIRISETLTNADIEHRVIDGVALAHTGYDDPALRSFEGVSVLVQAADLSRVLDLLAEDGATRISPELRAGFDQRFADSVRLSLEEVAVRVCRTLGPGQFGVDMFENDLFVLRRVIGIAGIDLPVLDPTDSLLVACYRLALGQVEPDLSAIRDVALLAGARGKAAFDSARFDDSVDRWQGRAVIRRAVRLVERRLGDCLPKELSWYADVWIDSGDREALAAYLIEDDDDRETALEVTTFKALPMADRPAFALAVGLSDGAEPVDRLKELFSRRRG